MAKSNLQFKGFADVQKILDALPKALGPKTVQEALLKGSKPLVKQTKANASHADHSGNLSKSIGAIKGKGGQKGAGIYVGPRRGRGKNAKGHHAHFVEYGVAPRIVDNPKKGFYKKGTKLGDMPAQPFLRPAWEQTNGQVKADIAKALREVLSSNFKNVKF
jgi:HK97 gp10 family phage protein